MVWIVDGFDFFDFKLCYGVLIVCIYVDVFGYWCGVIGNNGLIDFDGVIKVI